MRYLQYLHNVAMRTDDRLANPPFGLMLVIAFSMHLVGMLGLDMMHIGAPESVPVKNLMLRLGGGDDLQEEETALAIKAAALAPAAAPAAPQEAKQEIEKPVMQQKQAAPKPTEQPHAQAMPAPTPVQQFHPRHAPSGNADNTPAGVGNPYGNTQSARAEAMARYEQLLSAWIEKHKIYPKEAYAEGMQGRVILRIRIDRSGQVQFSKVEQSSGFPLLDEAVIATMREANPVPAVPVSYPGGKLLEFRIPIDFRMS